MTEEQRDLLCRGLTRLGVPYTPEAVERLRAAGVMARVPTPVVSL